MITTILFYIMIFALMIVTVWALLGKAQDKDTIRKLQKDLNSVHSTNPWKSQLMLMMKSNQQVPREPMMTKTTMLYGALLLEELGETFFGLARGMEHVSMGRGTKMHELAKEYAQTAVWLEASSVAFRKKLKELNEQPKRSLLPRDIAKEILDGCTDLHVVAAGLSIAAGLPGQAGHDRVAVSNLSKQNPTTGMIDKDASGKWIKGAEYAPPDLDGLLTPYYTVSNEV